jgi:FkbM family methyltransferase
MEEAAASLSSVLCHAYGLARSSLIYRANPVKRRRARAFYRRFVAAGDLCFDIGAHLGDRTATFRKLGARVVAVEPQPRLLTRLARRFGTDPGVALVAAALGAARGRAELAIDPMNPTIATLSRDFIRKAGASPGFRAARWRERAMVEVMTLDALIAAHGLPAFCKIDVEGYEDAVLEGLSQPLPALSLEYLPAALEPALAAIARLERLGPYRFNRSIGESMRLHHPCWLGAAEIAAELRRIPAEDGAGDVYALLDGAASSR